MPKLLLVDVVVTDNSYWRSSVYYRPRFYCL